MTQIRDQHRQAIDYRYDPIGQLLAAVQPGLDERFALDPAGNLLEAQPEAGIPPPAPAPPSTTLPDSLAEPNATHALTDQGRSEPRPASLPKVTHNLLKTYLGLEYDCDADGNTIRKIAR